MAVDPGGTSLRVRTIQGLFWSAVQRTGGQAISLLAFILLSRLLPPTAFGLLALANALVLVGMLLIEQSVNQALVQRAVLSSAHLDGAFALSLSIALLLVALTQLLAGPIASVFHEPMLGPVLRWLSLAFIFSGLRATQMALLQRQLRFRQLAYRTAAAEMFGGVAGVVMALAGLGVWSLVGQVLGRGLAGVVVLWSVSDWRPSLRVSGQAVRELTSFSLPVLADRLVNVVQSRADDVIIGLALGATSLGYYSVGYRILSYLLQLMSGTVQSVALPVMSRLQDDLTRLRQVFLALQRYLALAAFPVFVGIALVAPDVIPLLLGPQWGPSIPVMRILALAGAAKTFPTSSASLLVAVGRPGLQLRLNLLTTGLAILGFALVVKQGILAVAIVHLGVNLLLVPLHAVVARRTTQARIAQYLRSFRAPVAGVLAMSACLLFVDSLRAVDGPSLVWAVGQVVLGAAVYFVVSYLADGETYRRARRALAEGVITWSIVRGPDDRLQAE